MGIIKDKFPWLRTNLEMRYFGTQTCTGYMRSRLAHRLRFSNGRAALILKYCLHLKCFQVLKFQISRPFHTILANSSLFQLHPSLFSKSINTRVSRFYACLTPNHNVIIADSIRKAKMYVPLVTRAVATALPSATATLPGVHHNLPPLDSGLVLGSSTDQIDHAVQATHSSVQGPELRKEAHVPSSNDSVSGAMGLGIFGPGPKVSLV